MANNKFVSHKANSKVFVYGLTYEQLQRRLSASLIKNDFVFDYGDAIGSYDTTNFIKEVGEQEARKIVIKIGKYLKKDILKMERSEGKSYKEVDEAVVIKTKYSSEFNYEDYYFKTAPLYNPKLKRVVWTVVLHK